MDSDARVVETIDEDEMIQLRRIAGMQPDATMRGADAQALDILGAVDRKTSAKENRMWHRRILILTGVMHSPKQIRPKAARWGAVTVSPSRNAPLCVASAVNRNRH